MQKQTLRILVVENHSDTRQGIQLFLQALGYDATLTGSMEAALALAAKEFFDVLLSDISLPDGDGWTLLRTLAARDLRPLRAIAMSGLGAPEDFARSRAAGFVRHLLKPFPPEELEAALRETVEVPTPSGAQSPASTLPGPGRGGWQQRMHDGLCQQLAAASLLQAALVLRLEGMDGVLAVASAPRKEDSALALLQSLAEVAAEARNVGQLIHEALQESQNLMRELMD